MGEFAGRAGRHRVEIRTGGFATDVVEFAQEGR